MRFTLQLLAAGVMAWFIIAMHLSLLLVILMRRPHTHGRMVLADMTFSLLRPMVEPVLRAASVIHRSPRMLCVLLHFWHAYARARHHELFMRQAHEAMSLIEGSQYQRNRSANTTTS